MITKYVNVSRYTKRRTKANTLLLRQGIKRYSVSTSLARPQPHSPPPERQIPNKFTTPSSFAYTRLQYPVAEFTTGGE